jgi:hypothetical protein
MHMIVRRQHGQILLAGADPPAPPVTRPRGTYQPPSRCLAEVMT